MNRDNDDRGLGPLRTVASDGVGKQDFIVILADLYNSVRVKKFDCHIFFVLKDLDHTPDIPIDYILIPDASIFDVNYFIVHPEYAALNYRVFVQFILQGLVDRITAYIRSAVCRADYLYIGQWVIASSGHTVGDEFHDHA